MFEKITIIVSAFISNGNKHRNIDQYISHGKKLLESNCLKIIFIEREVFHEHLKEYTIEEKYSFQYMVNDAVKTFEYVIFNNIIFVFFERNDNYLYAYQDEMTEFQLNTDNPNKDTIDYMFIQCHKTEWLHMSICLMNQKENRLFTNTEVLWIDFGIFHMIRNKDVLKQEIENLRIRVSKNSDNSQEEKKSENSIRIASCWDLTKNYIDVDLYHKVAWYFAGSIFGGSENILIEFAERTKEKCIQIIRERKSLMWEVNVWYLIYLDKPELFNSYICGHDTSIITNY
jgi:hypothetical protein